ncbi:hypothetical protein N0V94_001325 [Neodidymelliopsis sp. IMI 364377]|nr:hypothetical protein N0V94_001325 [Neodidymelliopsis sp. IMI 364377]
MSTNKYEEALRAAEEHFYVNSEECIRLAKHNLTDPLLPPYYDIQNCILIASAEDMWEDADVWRRAARQAYRTFHAKASRANDTATLKEIGEARKQLDELDELLAEEFDAFLEEERVDLPSTPPSEKEGVFWGSEVSDVGSDEGDEENESTLKLGDEQGEASGTLDIPLRGRIIPPPEPKDASTPKSTTVSTKSTSTPKTTTASTTASTKSFLRDTASSAAKKRDAPKDTTDNTRAQTKRGRGEGGR